MLTGSLRKEPVAWSVDILPDAFLLGNISPDVHIGFMVPDYSHKGGNTVESHRHQNIAISSYRRYQRGFMGGLNPASVCYRLTEPNVSYCSAEQRSNESSARLQNIVGIGARC